MAARDFFQPQREASSRHPGDQARSRGKAAPVARAAKALVVIATSLTSFDFPLTSPHFRGVAASDIFICGSGTPSAVDLNTFGFRTRVGHCYAGQNRVSDQDK